MTLRTKGRALFFGAGIMSAAPAMWWLGTLLPTEVSPGYYADYMWKPMVLADRTRHAIGIGAIVTVLVVTVALARAIRSMRLRSEWLGVLLPVAALFAYAGGAYSIVTAPVTGANIGGGLAVLAAGPFALATLSVAVTFALRLRRASGAN